MQIKVLQKTSTLGPGGIQRFLTSVQSNINRDCIQFDYFLNTLEEGFFTKLAIDLGSIIYGRKRNRGSAAEKIGMRYFLFYKVIKKQKYNIVHINENLLMTAISTVVARLGGARVIIAHSHNDHRDEQLPWYEKRIINPLSRRLIARFATDYFSCSQNASRWMFGDALNLNSKIQIINNGIQSDLFKFNSQIAKEFRKKMNLEKKFVIGHVGRFYYQKNHKFILEVFNEVKKHKNNAVLVLVGEGELKSEIENYAKKLNIFDDILFYGLCNNVNQVLQTFDAFIFPSHYEGLGIAAIEAQASSIATFCAEETIAKEVFITPLCNFISLNSSSEYWAKKIIEKAYSYKKYDTSYDIIKANFDISYVAKSLEEFYTSKEII